MEKEAKVAVVIPCFMVEDHIAKGVTQIPIWISHIIAVNDASPDKTSQILESLAAQDNRLIIINHRQNLGVGGATKSGYLEALKQDAEVVVKMDGDDQMDPGFIVDMISLILEGKADYTKGNRFTEWEDLESMPILRKIGNLGLSFMTKIATGYWNLFDPTNGYTAISAKTLRQLNFSALEDRFLFETSLLVELYRLRKKSVQIPMPAIYAAQSSSLNTLRAFFSFSAYLTKATWTRFVRQYIWQDFTAISVFGIFGIIAMAFGIAFGAYHWIQSSATMVPATTGTVMISVLPIILGFQLLLQAIVLDIQNTPK